jgi:hypothetical protein
MQGNDKGITLIDHLVTDVAFLSHPLEARLSCRSLHDRKLSVLGIGIQFFLTVRTNNLAEL